MSRLPASPFSAKHVQSAKWRAGRGPFGVLIPFSLPPGLVSGIRLSGMRHRASRGAASSELPNSGRGGERRPSLPLACSVQGSLAIALEEAALAATLASRLLPALRGSQAWARLQPALFRLAWLYGRLNIRVRSCVFVANVQNIMF